MYGLKCSLEPFISRAEKQQSADESPVLIAEGLGLQNAWLLLGSEGLLLLPAVPVGKER